MLNLMGQALNFGFVLHFPENARKFRHMIN